MCLLTPNEDVIRIMSINSSEKEAGSRLDLLDAAIRQLEAVGQDAPRRTAEWLLMDVAGCDRGQLYAHPEQELEPGAVRQFARMVERCADGEPLQHILGYTSFRGLRIDVSPAVMIPRPETEEVVEAALHVLEPVDAPRILDIGTGSGCIALACKRERPDADVWGWDVSREALSVARKNARRLELDAQFERVDILAADLETCAPGPLDLLISNPPYIPEDEAEALPSVVRDYDPDVALFSGEDPLRFYRVLARQATALCASNAAVVVEVHADYAEDAANLFRRRRFANVRLHTDLQGCPRILVARCSARETDA